MRSSSGLIAHIACITVRFTFVVRADGAVSCCNPERIIDIAPSGKGGAFALYNLAKARAV
jgi:hypothetical protein